MQVTIAVSSMDSTARAAALRKRHFLRHLYIKINILPRQARDNHRENSKKVPFSLSSHSIKSWVATTHASQEKTTMRL
jgi:hypothetical protein